MIVLGIESSCDETACAVVKNGKEILSNVISSQTELHAPFGGVVPELACRKHVEVMIPTLDKALSDANVTLQEIDLIAVTDAPGLIGPLLLGINTAEALALALNKPCVRVNHVEAHLYAPLMSQQAISFPALGIVLSGGHTSFFFMENFFSFKIISQTVDDAIGEAFDKVASLLGYPYPGGPYIEKLAKKGDPKKFSFKAGSVKEKPLDFSFSGLKTAVLYAMKDKTLSESDKCDLAASFQYAAFSNVIEKAKMAAEKFNCKSLLFGGGVTNSKTLREFFQKEVALDLVWPGEGLSLDNAAMIAGLGFHKSELK